MNLRISFFGLAAALMGATALSSCGDNGTIGSSLLEDRVEIIVDSVFTVTGESVEMSKVQPRTVAQIIGNINVPGFGSMRSSAAAQFLPSVQIDTAYTSENLDSVFLNLVYVAGAYIGDSIVPMGVAAYPLNEILTTDLYTDSPVPAHASAWLGQGMFSPSTLVNDSLASNSTRSVRMKLPLQFGKDLLDAYYQNPADYANGQTFTRNVFKGLYIDSYFGTGRLTNFSRTSITMNVHKNTVYSEDSIVTTYDELEYYAVSPELVNNNYIDIKLDPALTARIESGTPMLVAPAAYNARMRFPAPEIIASYQNHGGLMAVMNTVTMSLPVDTIESNGVAAPPAYVLMVLERDLDTFFAQNKLPDSKTSFYATYDSSTGAYEFSGLNVFISDLMDQEEPLTEEDYTFCLVPVTINFEVDVASSYYSYSYIVSEVLPYIDGPAVAVLDFENAKIKLTYSRQVAL